MLKTDFNYLWSEWFLSYSGTTMCAAIKKQIRRVPVQLCARWRHGTCQSKIMVGVLKAVVDKFVLLQKKISCTAFWSLWLLCARWRDGTCQSKFTVGVLKSSRKNFSLTTKNNFYYCLLEIMIAKKNTFYMIFFLLPVQVIFASGRSSHKEFKVNKKVWTK